ncbi:uncharacterized protein IL334_000760 [Kwoniella shivajii]|uniref:Nascent polypeptide-associated complex subunit alpha-like UBA domain-containing protein n=1 Tax=Kwoniella shivajii TaxID=564305 RepID=A0ABZ1CQ12_9TREE|nr:hypothetical protein IL334_000760 [Kwoniella shivajii]
MPVKRELLIDPYTSQEGEDEKPPQTPTKKKPSKSMTPSPKKTKTAPSPGTSSAATTPIDKDGLSAKGKYALMIIEKGIEKLDKADVEAATGLKARQQADMTRKDGKGALWKSLMGAIEKL